MIEVREGRLGKCVHAARDIAPGEVILTGWGPCSPVRTRHTIQVDHDLHVTIRSPIELINHSCEPNCGVLIRRGVPSLEIHALRAIRAGEELSTDYASFEDEIQYMTGPCLCGTPSCRGRITGYHDLPEHRRAALGPYIAEYLQELEAPVSRAG
jgi:hypothetical protein